MSEEYFTLQQHNMHFPQQPMELGTFSKIDHFSGHKANLNQYKKFALITMQ
jgi:hypothetical protein